MSTLTDEILRRGTFAIIPHPEAGKTTLTKKLLLFGGTIQLAGEVNARGERRRARSDWTALERERRTSVSSAVMSFEHEGLAFNLLDTPGHQDFRTYGECNPPAFIPVSFLIGAKFIGSQASLLNGGGVLAAQAGELHPPYALVLGCMAALAANGFRRCHRRVKADPPCHCHNCMVIA